MTHWPVLTGYLPASPITVSRIGHRGGRACVRASRSAAPRRAVADRNVHVLLARRFSAMLRSAHGVVAAAPIWPLQSGGTPMSVRSTRVKAVLGSVGLLIATASAATAVPASAGTQGADSTYIVLYRGGVSSADAAATVSNARR